MPEDATRSMRCRKRTSASSPACWHWPRGMDDSQNLDRIPRDTVRDEIPGSVDKEFSGTGYALGSPE